MKAWFDICQNFTLGDSETTPVLLGFSCNKHFCGNPKYFKPWRGWSAYLHFFKWTLQFTIVSDYDAYHRRMYYYIYKKPGERIKPL